MGDETTRERVLQEGWGFGDSQDFIEEGTSDSRLVEIGFAVREIEQFFGPGDCYETYAPFLFKVSLFAGKDIFDHAYKEDHGKLESFAAVDSHQANALPVIADSFILKGFGVFNERLDVVKAGCCHYQLVEVFNLHVIGTGKIAVCHETIIIKGAPEQLDQFCRLQGFCIGNEWVDQMHELSNVFSDVGQFDGHGLQLIVKVQTRPWLKLVQLDNELSPDVAVGHVDDRF